MTPKAAPIKEVRLTRFIEAPQAAVWRAWTDPHAFQQWMGPVGWDITDCTIDLRPGGRWTTTQRSPDGELHPTGGHYTIVFPPAHLGFIWSITAPDGKVLCQAEHDLRLAARAGGTDLTLEIRILVAEPGSEPFVDGVKDGWSGTLGKLADHLEG
jgi:uncharacterized protein YndB with AHSA1/START domain